MLADLLRGPRFTFGPAPQQRHGPGLVGTVAIVTGGDSPLARAVALCMAHNGADVVLAYRHAHGPAREAVRRMREQGAGAVALWGELDNPAFSRQVAAATLNQLDRIDPQPDLVAPPAQLGGRSVAPASSAIAGFADALRVFLAAHRVRVKAMTRGPIWTPLVPRDPDTEMPVNQHQGNNGPCFVFVARSEI